VASTGLSNVSDTTLSTAIGDEEFWNDLLEFIEDGKVIPIVGQGVTTIAPSNELLAPWLAGKLARSLSIDRTELSSDASLNDVVCQYLLRGGSSETVYKRLHRILLQDCPKPGKTLEQLVSIDKFRLFLSTTFDSLLETAINTVRFGGEFGTRVCAYSPYADPVDLPARMKYLSGSTVYHILGKSSKQEGDFVVWEDDMLEFILGLHRHLKDDLPNLAKDLKDQKLHCLALGLNFSDWLVRFFLRAARQDRLTDSVKRIDYIAEEGGGVWNDGLVIFSGL